MGLMVEAVPEQYVWLERTGASQHRSVERGHDRESVLASGTQVGLGWFSRELLEVDALVRFSWSSPFARSGRHLRTSRPRRVTADVDHVNPATLRGP